MNPNFFNFSKRKKRDVLLELLTDKPFEGVISKKEINALNKLIGDTPQIDLTHGKQPKKTKKITAKKKKKEIKKKTTHYISEEVFENLECVKKEIRSIIPENLRSRVTKSQIVNQALTIILKEFEARGKNSRLVRNIVQKK